MSRKRIAIIGAGPIGLEAGFLARLRGFEVSILDRGRVAENVRSWGHVRLFSPFGLNSSSWGREALESSRLPEPDAILTGAEHAERYLLPLSQHALIADSVRERTEVRGVGRERLWKGDRIGQPARGESPFRILLRSSGGLESVAEADFVFDCTGTYGNNNWIGAGGLPAPGESCCERIGYVLPDIAGSDRKRFANKTALVVGSGYSAATAVTALAEVAKQETATNVVWLTRGGREQPLSPIADDQLPERSQVTQLANNLATSEDSPVKWHCGGRVTDVVSEAENGLRVTITSDDGDSEELRVDRVLGLVGYRPARDLYEELQVHECYATQGPIRLAASLLGETSQDCLAQSETGVDVLKNPEPDFFILGAKSYGRDSRFLLKTGIAQVEAVIDLISEGQSV